MSDVERVFRKFSGHHWELRFPPGVNVARAYCANPDGMRAEGCMWSLEEAEQGAGGYYEDTPPPLWQVIEGSSEAVSVADVQRSLDNAERFPFELTLLRTFRDTVLNAAQETPNHQLPSTIFAADKAVRRGMKPEVTNVQ